LQHGSNFECPIAIKPRYKLKKKVMKNLKTMLTAIAILFIGMAVISMAKPGTNNLTKTDVINKYVDAVAHGKTAALNSILDDGLQYNIMRGDNFKTMNKDQFISNLKNGSVSDASVSTTMTTIEEDDDHMVVKIDFKYADFTRSDVVTLQRSNDWSITKIDNSFK